MGYGRDSFMGMVFKSGKIDGAIIKNLTKFVDDRGWLADFEKKVGQMPIFRIMPNTAIEICESITCIALNKAGKEKQDTFRSILKKLSK